MITQQVDILANVKIKELNENFNKEYVKKRYMKKCKSMKEISIEIGNNTITQ